VIWNLLLIGLWNIIYHNMIKETLDALKLCKGETETIRIAKGKHSLPNGLKEGYKQLKQEIQWLKYKK